MQEWMVKEATIPEAGPNNDDVAKEPLDLGVGYVCSTPHQFTDWLYGVTETQESPILFRVRDTSSVNEMTLY